MTRMNSAGNVQKLFVSRQASRLLDYITFTNLSQGIYSNIKTDDLDRENSF